MMGEDLAKALIRWLEVIPVQDDKEKAERERLLNYLRDDPSLELRLSLEEAEKFREELDVAIDGETRCSEHRLAQQVLKD